MSTERLGGSAVSTGLVAVVVLVVIAFGLGATAAGEKQEPLKVSAEEIEFVGLESVRRDWS